MTDLQSYRVLLNEEWELEDLYEFPHALYQCYAFIYCLDSELQPQDKRRIDIALSEYPWRGGFSYVNIYTVFKNQIPVVDRPKIKSIQKASPGWLDLILNINVASQLAVAITTLSGTAIAALAAYNQAYKLLASINAGRRKDAIARKNATVAETKAFNALCIELAKSLGYKNLRELHERTGDPEISLKLLMAHHRRMLILLEYDLNGKAKLTLPNSSNQSSIL